MPRISFNLPEYRRKHSTTSASSFRPVRSEPGWKMDYDQKPTRKVTKPVPTDKQGRVYTGPLNKLVTYAVSSLHGQGVSFKEKPGMSKFDAGVQALMKSIKKINRRIEAAKKAKDQAKLVKLEELHTRQLHLLQEANSVKQHLDAKSLNRMNNEQAIASGELVRIGKRDEKLVPRKRPKGGVSPWTAEEKMALDEEFRRMLGE